MKLPAAAALLVLASILSGCAGPPLSAGSGDHRLSGDPVSIEELTEQLAGLDAVEEAWLGAGPAPRVISVMLDPGADPAELAPVVQLFLDASPSAPETHLQVMLSLEGRLGENTASVAQGSASDAVFETVLDEEPHAQRILISSTVDSRDFAVAAASAWWRTAQEASGVSVRVWSEGEEGEQLRVDISPAGLSATEAAEALVVFESAVDREALSVDRLDWRIESRGVWRGRGALPDAEQVAAILEVAKVADGETTVSGDRVSLSLQVRDGHPVRLLLDIRAPLGGTDPAVYEPAERVLLTLLRQDADIELVLISGPTTLVIYEPDGCPQPGSIFDDQPVPQLVLGGCGTGGR